MKYASTRSADAANSVSAAQAIKQGLAADGGLFMPQEIPALTQDEILMLKDKTYIERAVYVLSIKWMTASIRSSSGTDRPAPSKTWRSS